MERINGYYISRYEARRELEDGRLLRMEYSTSELPGTWNDPPESDMGEPEYWIDNVKVHEEDLPKEITQVVIDEMIENAKDISNSHDFGRD